MILWLTSIDYHFFLRMGHIFLALHSFLLYLRNCKCYVIETLDSVTLFRGVLTLLF